MVLDKRKKQKDEVVQWVFVLYVSGKTRLSRWAIRNLHEICEEHLEGRYSIQIIDIEKQPQIGIKKGIIAFPTLIRELPGPVKRIIGDLSEREKALVAMDIKKMPTQIC